MRVGQSRPKGSSQPSSKAKHFHIELHEILSNQICPIGIQKGLLYHFQNKKRDVIQIFALPSYILQTIIIKLNFQVPNCSTPYFQNKRMIHFYPVTFNYFDTFSLVMFIFLYYF